MSVAAKRSREGWVRHLGRPFIERELGDNPIRWFGAATGLSAALAVVNVGYYIWLLSQEQNPWGYLSYEEERFIQGGLDSVAGALDLQVVIIMCLGLLLVAPTLACLTVTREAQSRTLDMLLTSPMSALGLHNGITFGALARLAPWLAPLFGVHLAIGLFGGIQLSTLLATSSLLLVGGWALTSLGTMFGVLMQNRAKGPLAGLMIFCLFGFAFGLPITAVFEGSAEHLAMLSPASAILHSLVTDSNFLLSRIEHGPQVLYEGRLLDIPILPTAFSLAIVTFFGVLSTHVGTRRFSDAMAPPVDSRVAVFSMAFVAMILSVLIAREMPDQSWWALDSDYLEVYSYLGRELMMGGFVLVVLAFPWVLLFGLSSIPSAPWLERARLWEATRPSDLGQRARVGSAAGQFLLLAALPVFFACMIPFLVKLPLPLTEATFGSRWLMIIPMIWGVVAVLEIILIWRLTKQKTLNTVAAFIGVMWLGISGLVYSALILEDNSPDFSDFIIGHDFLSLSLSLMLMLGFAVAPFVLHFWRRMRGQQFAIYLNGRMSDCEQPADEALESFEWPAPQPTEGERLCRLRPSLHKEVRSLESWLVGARPIKTRVGAESWLALRDSELVAWGGHADGEGALQTRIDMSKPFVLSASLQPQGDGHGPDVTATLNLTVSQKQGEGVGEVLRISFAVPVRQSTALSSLPRQDQRLDRLGPRDARPLLAAVRYYADAAGVMLPV